MFSTLPTYSVDTRVGGRFGVIFRFYYYCECRFFYSLADTATHEEANLPLISSNCPSSEVSLMRKPLSIKLNSSIPGAPTNLSLASKTLDSNMSTHPASLSLPSAIARYPRSKIHLSNGSPLVFLITTVTRLATPFSTSLPNNEHTSEMYSLTWG